MIQGVAGSVPIVTGVINGKTVKIAMLNVAKVPGASCHFSFRASKEERQMEEILINDIRYIILSKEASQYIPEMWTFHAKEDDNGIS